MDRSNHGIKKTQEANNKRWECTVHKTCSPGKPNRGCFAGCSCSQWQETVKEKMSFGNWTRPWKVFTCRKVAMKQGRIPWLFWLPHDIERFPYPYPLKDGTGRRSWENCRSNPGPFRDERRNTVSRAQKQLGRWAVGSSKRWRLSRFSLGVLQLKQNKQQTLVPEQFTRQQPSSNTLNLAGGLLWVQFVIFVSFLPLAWLISFSWPPFAFLTPTCANHNVVCPMLGSWCPCFLGLASLVDGWQYASSSQFHSALETWLKDKTWRFHGRDVDLQSIDRPFFLCKLFFLSYFLAINFEGLHPSWYVFNNHAIAN